ncbi:MAG TPA: hypothetical protein VF818_13405 [Ktedonobacterales bacterium]
MGQSSHHISLYDTRWITMQCDKHRMVGKVPGGFQPAPAYKCDDEQDKGDRETAKRCVVPHHPHTDLGWTAPIQPNEEPANGEA